MTDEDILREEMALIVADIITVYNQSGKKASGLFADGLEIKSTENSVELWGYSYLAGRAAGKMPPVKAIEKWINDKGIRPIEAKMSTTSLAWAIAKNISKFGTKQEGHLEIYRQVITPERIDSIIKKVSLFNVARFTKEVENTLQNITKTI